MAEINRVIQVAHSNTLDKASTPELLQRELKAHVVKLNDALRRLSQLVYASPTGGGIPGTSTSSTSSSSSSSGSSSSSTTYVSSGFAKHFLVMGS